jgi:hypothetical protein
MGWCVEEKHDATPIPTPDPTNGAVKSRLDAGGNALI